MADKQASLLANMPSRVGKALAFCGMAAGATGCVVAVVFLVPMLAVPPLGLGVLGLGLLAGICAGAGAVAGGLIGRLIGNAIERSRARRAYDWARMNGVTVHELPQTRLTKSDCQQPHDLYLRCPRDVCGEGVRAIWDAGVSPVAAMAGFVFGCAAADGTRASRRTARGDRDRDRDGSDGCDCGFGAFPMGLF